MHRADSPAHTTHARLSTPHLVIPDVPCTASHTTSAHHTHVSTRLSTAYSKSAHLRTSSRHSPNKGLSAPRPFQHSLCSVSTPALFCALPVFSPQIRCSSAQPNKSKRVQSHACSTAPNVTAPHSMCCCVRSSHWATHSPICKACHAHTRGVNMHALCTHAEIACSTATTWCTECCGTQEDSESLHCSQLAPCSKLVACGRACLLCDTNEHAPHGSC
jgi:hypothetical protein